MNEKPRYVIVGAGAIGCSIGGFLAVSGAETLFLARPSIAEAISGGFTVSRGGGPPIRATGSTVTEIRDISPGPRDILLVTVKSQHMAEVVEHLGDKYDRQTPLVCLQNGVTNEDIARARFDNVYAGLVLFTAVQFRPDVVSHSLGNHIAIGCYPEGVDGLAREICDDLAVAGFDVLASPHVMAMKWGKLIANLNNATHAITGYWLERSAVDSEMRVLMAAVREEGIRVLDAAGIPCEPPENEPSLLRIRASTEELKQDYAGPQADVESAVNMPKEKRAYASMWQDLNFGRPSHEADSLNGVIIQMGKRLGIPTPMNSFLLETIDRMSRERIKPGLYTPAELQELLNRRVESETASG